MTSKVNIADGGSKTSSPHHTVLNSTRSASSIHPSTPPPTSTMAPTTSDHRHSIFDAPTTASTSNLVDTPTSPDKTVSADSATTKLWEMNTTHSPAHTSSTSKHTAQFQLPHAPNSYPKCKISPQMFNDILHSSWPESATVNIHPNIYSTNPLH